MFVPIYISSDKTTVSVATGQNDFHPVYISVGNIHNNIRRADAGGFVLLAFLPIPRGEYFMGYGGSLMLKPQSRKPKGCDQSPLQKISAAVDSWITFKDPALRSRIHEEVRYYPLR